MDASQPLDVNSRKSVVIMLNYLKVWANGSSTVVERSPLNAKVEGSFLAATGRTWQQILMICRNWTLCRPRRPMI
jgi:hypothetical protein